MPQLRAFAITNQPLVIALATSSLTGTPPRLRAVGWNISHPFLLRYRKWTHWVQMDPLSLTTIQSSFNMAVLFQPSIVLKPNPPSSFGLHWTSWSYGSYRRVQGLTRPKEIPNAKWNGLGDIIRKPESGRPIDVKARKHWGDELHSSGIWQQPSFFLIQFFGNSALGWWARIWWNPKKIEFRLALGLGSFSLACDRGCLPVRARRERHTRHQSNLKNSDSTISVSLTGVSSPLGNP